MKNNGLIIINAYAPSDGTRQVSRMRDEFVKRGIITTVMRNNEFIARIFDGKSNVASDYSFCLYLDKDKYVSRILEKSGIRLFNRADAIEKCDDKMTTHIMLADNGINMPDTVPGLLCYDRSAPLCEKTISAIESIFGYPVVVKESFGSLGKGVFKADNRTQLILLCERLKTTPHLFQRYIEKSCGKDMRVIVIGGKTIGGILRKSDGDFRSNIGLGGKATAAVVPDEISRMAEKAASVLGLDYCGIDFLLDDAPLLCEVNSNAYFDAFEHATGINVAAAYAEHIINDLK